MGDQLGLTTIPEARALGDGALPRGMIEAEGEHTVAGAHGTTHDRVRPLAETVAAKPLEQAEHSRRAQEHSQDEATHCMREQALRREQTDARSAYDGLKPWQQGSATDWGHTIASKLSIMGAELLVLTLALMLVPGSSLDHWLTAGFVAFGITIFADVLGWIMARGWDELSPRYRGVFWLTCGFALTGLFVWMVLSMGQFRGEAFKRLMSGDVIALDPTFISPLQLLLGAAAAISSMKFYLGVKGRRLLASVTDLGHQAALATSQGDASRHQSRKERDAAARAGRARAVAETGIHYIQAKGVTLVDGIRAGTRFNHAFFGTMFLRQRHLPALDLALAAETYRFRLRRIRDLAVLALGSLAFLVCVVSLALGERGVALVALAVTLGHAGIGLALHLRELRRHPPIEHHDEPDRAEGPVGAFTPSKNGADPAKGVPA